MATDYFSKQRTFQVGLYLSRLLAQDFFFFFWNITAECSTPAFDAHQRTMLKLSFDEILCHIGGFGKFQKTLYVWICLPQIFLAFHMLVSIFTAAVPPHSCRSIKNSTESQASSNFSLVPDGHLVLTCSALLNYSSVVRSHSGKPHEICEGGWEYSTDTFQNTVVTEVSYAKHFLFSAFVWVYTSFCQDGETLVRCDVKETNGFRLVNEVASQVRFEPGLICIGDRLSDRWT